MTEMQSRRTLLAEENARLIEQGVSLITGLEPDTYRANTHELFSSGVGKHFRHVLDFYDRLLSGHATTVDYEARRRDERVERDPDYACRVARTYAGALRDLVGPAGSGAPAPGESASVRVRTEILHEDGSGVEAGSTLERELAVLASHTIHHFAIIALLLRIQGVAVPEGFGVAPSTLRYQAGTAGGSA